MLASLKVLEIPVLQTAEVVKLLITFISLHSAAGDPSCICWTRICQQECKARGGGGQAGVAGGFAGMAGCLQLTRPVAGSGANVKPSGLSRITTYSDRLKLNSP